MIEPITERAETRRQVLLTSMAIVGGGLLTASKKPQPRPREPEPDEALVYIYYFANLTQPVVIELNGVPVLTLGNHEHSWFYIAAGDYELGVRVNRFADLLGRARPAPHRLIGGRANYFKYGTVIPPVPTYQRTYGLAPKEAEDALSDLEAERRAWGHPSKYKRPSKRLSEVGGLFD